MLKIKSLKSAEKIIAVSEKIAREQFGINKKTLYSSTRDRHVTETRFVLWYILKKHFEWDYSRIGRLYKKCHSSIIYGVRVVENCDDKEAIKEIVDHYYPHIHSPNSNNK